MRGASCSTVLKVVGDQRRFLALGPSAPLVRVPLWPGSCARIPAWKPELGTELKSEWNGAGAASAREPRKPRTQGAGLHVFGLMTWVLAGSPSAEETLSISASSSGNVIHGNVAAVCANIKGDDHKGGRRPSGYPATAGAAVGLRNETRG